MGEASFQMLPGPRPRPQAPSAEGWGLLLSPDQTHINVGNVWPGLSDTLHFNLKGPPPQNLPLLPLQPGSFSMIRLQGGEAGPIMSLDYIQTL